MKRDPTVQECGTTEYLSSPQHEALTKKSTLFPITKTLSKSSLNRFPRSGKTSELKVMTNQLQANYKPRNGCQDLPQGSQLKIFWHERDEHHLSLACLLQDVYVCVHVSVRLRLKWMSCLGFPTELMVSPEGSSMTGMRQLRTPQFGMLLAQSRDTVPGRGKGSF